MKQIINSHQQSWLNSERTKENTQTWKWERFVGKVEEGVNVREMGRGGEGETGQCAFIYICEIAYVKLSKKEQI